nr:hypothetical protein [Tanacetum cinerariifolium]
NPQLELQEKGVIDSECSRHMTRNMSCLSKYEESDGGYVAFGRDPKGGKITSKGKINTGKLDFEDVYFVKELKFNLISFSQMCDEKSNVLFTYTECVVLSPDFKLLDESQVLLRVQRKNNMCSIDLKNVAPLGCLTCLFAKATLDESNLWHRRLGHINFKTMNKLGIMKKMYYLVVTNDYSRFSWVFFLETKEETSGILMAFIIGIENLIDHKVKIIKCDNRAEFKKKEMNQYCEEKGIKREFSVARTPQQNGVAKRKNRTLIEAARTMLADSKLPTTFWAEAVNTACYVQNRVLVIKPHNKTPYKLFHGRTLSLSFMRPFRCPVKILNTLDPLGKFDGKPDEGFSIGYSVNSKEFRVFNSRTRIVEETLHITSLENKPNFKDAKNLGNEDNEVLSIDVPRVSQEKVSNVNNTNNNNIVSLTTNDTGIRDNAIDKDIVYGCADDPSMPNLEEIVYSDEDEDVGAEADMTNSDTNIPISPIPTTRIHKDHPDKLLQFKLQQVWTLVDLPYGKRAIGAKWIYKNKKAERVARIEAIRLFLAYASFKDFEVYQMDVKSAFLYGRIEEEVYVSQPLGFEDPKFPDIVYKVEKALKEMYTEFEKMMHKKFQMSSMRELTFFLVLQVTQKDDEIFISQDKYVDKILKKFDFLTVKTANTHMETSKPLLKDENAEDVDVHLYRSIIGSLIYLTSSRHDIMFVVCACARFQVTPEVSHLYAMKRIFRYLKGQPTLGLWYPKDSPFNLEAYTDNDYAGASLDRKSTAEGCQFLKRRLILWQCKKQTLVTNSTTKAEYVAASNCYG